MEKIKITATKAQKATSKQLDAIAHDYLGVKQSLDDESYGCRAGAELSLPTSISATDGVYSDTKEALLAKGVSEVSGTEYQRFMDDEVRKVFAKNVEGDEIAIVTRSKFKALTSISTWFQNNTAITHLHELKDTNITSITYGAFYKCTSLESLYMPNLTIMSCSSDTALFHSCTKAKVFVPNITTLGIRYCGPHTVDVGKKLTTVARLCFWNGWLSNLIIRNTDTVPTIVNDSNGGGHIGNVFVPESMIDSYKADSLWNSYYGSKLYAIGGEQWASVYGSTDEYADVAMYAPDDYDEIVAAYENA